MSDIEPYRVEVAPAAIRALRRLPGKIAAAVIEFITGPLSANPQPLSKRLVDDLAGYHSARRGDYRILLRINESDRMLLIVDIAHRAHAYRRR